MKISEIIENRPYSVSFEVFPPKTKDKVESVVSAARKIADLKPAFMSVTYGAGGGTSEYTVEVARQLQEEQGVPMMAHLTCITSDKETVDRQLELLREKRIQNILALRGDLPEGFETTEKNFKHAIELVREIKEFDPD
ncbi:MAG: methylenetetrahydrofolate reductase, partial [Lachnospiraceae bacterium]|nr:methylenetetrahydrofolate reductase [Lachnospiraceae bacterium]